MAEISVVIPTYCRRDYVATLLKGLAEQSFPAARFEAIVSIDGSEDGTAEMIDKLVVPYRLIRLWRPNRGRAAACNLGIQAARGRFVVLLDDDMEPGHDLLESHWRRHQTDGRLGVMGAVPVRVTKESSAVQKYIASRFNQHLQLLAAAGRGIVLRDFYSGNFSIRREYLMTVGGFDEDFKVYGNEDLELYVRLRQVGIQVIYCAEALAYQNYPKDFAALAHDNVAKGRTARLLVSKHPETITQLKLGAYREGSTARRLLRTLLLTIGWIWPGMPDLIITLAAWLERRQPPRLDLLYAFVLDYCYWSGAASATRMSDKAAGNGRRPPP